MASTTMMGLSHDGGRVLCRTKPRYSLDRLLSISGITRDACGHADDDPVVAQPPGNLWINCAALNFRRYGDEVQSLGIDQA